MSAATEEPGPKTRIVLATLLVGAGVYALLLGAGVVPSQPGAIKSAPWVLSACGIVIICAGLLLAITATPGAKNAVLPPSAPFALRFAQSALALVVIAAMGAVSGWIAFGEGERVFSSGFSIVGMSGQGSSSEMTGRIVFGAGAIMCGVSFVAVAWQAWRTLFKHRDD